MKKWITIFIATVTILAHPGPGVAAVAASTVTAAAPTGDYNHDGQVDVYDLSAMLASWKQLDTVTDMNGDGFIDIYDLSRLLSRWGKVAPTAPANLFANPSVETAAFGAPTGWQSASWGQNVTNFSYTNTGHTGTRSLRAQIANYVSGDAKWHSDEISVVPGQMYQYADYYQSDIASRLVAAFSRPGGEMSYQTLKTVPPSSAWSPVSAAFTVPSGATSVSVYHLIAANGYLATDDFSLTAYVPTGFNRGLVSFTFDDAWKSVYDNALPILAQNNVPSTQYLLTGKTSDGAYMTPAMMQAFSDQGSEIASHTINHPHLPALDLAQLQQELIGSKSWLESNLATSVTDFASPYGEYDAGVIVQIKQAGYASHRSTDVGFNSRDNFDAYDILVQNVDSSTSVAQVQAWINQAATTKTWLVLVYHQVTPLVPASSGAGESTYWTTPADLQQEITIARQAGLATTNVRAALGEVMPQLPH